MDCVHDREWRGLTGSMCIEDRLIGGDGLAHGVQLGACWLVGIFRCWQAAKLQQAGHQQESSLVCGQIGGGDLEVRRVGEAHGRTAARYGDRDAAERSFEH